MAVKKTTKRKTSTKKVVKETAGGKFVSPSKAKTDKKGTMTLTVPKDSDGVRSDKGKTHRKREPQNETEEFLEALPGAITNTPSETSATIKENIQEVEGETDWQQIAKDNVEAHGKVTAEEVRKLNEDAGLTGDMVSSALAEERGTNLPAQESLPATSDGVSNTEAPEASKDGETEPERKPCLMRRPTKAPDYTCLDEQQEALESPHHFTEVQYNAIINDENLCDNCREYNESV